MPRRRGIVLLATLAGAGARSLALQAARQSSSTLTLLRGTTLSTILLLSLALGIGLWQSERSLILMALVIGAAALITLTFRLHFIGLGRLPLLILAAPAVHSMLAHVWSWAAAAPGRPARPWLTFGFGLIGALRRAGCPPPGPSRRGIGA